MPTHELVLETELSIEECLARLTAQGAPRPPDILRMYRRPYPGTLLYRIRGNQLSLQLADSLLVGEEYSPELRGSMKRVATGTRIDALVGLPRRTTVGARVVWAIWAVWAAFCAWQTSASLPAVLALMLFAGACLVAFQRLLGRMRSGNAPRLVAAVESCLRAKRVV